MKILNAGDRVRTKYDFLSDGEIIKTIRYSESVDVFGYVIKLDEKAPNEYAYETDEVLLPPEDVRLLSEVIGDK